MGISSAGIGSGLDINSIISQLSAIERQPIQKLKTVAAKIDAQVSIYGKIQSNLSALRDASKALSAATAWSGAAASSSDVSAVTAKASSGAVAGSYTVQVDKLASVQSNVSGYKDAATFSAEGTLTIDLGTWSADGSAFAAKSAPISIDVGPPAKSLDQVRDIINGANAGVTASVLTDVNGSRLVVSSSALGASNGFRISVTDADGTHSDSNGLSSLAYNTAVGVSTMARTSTAANSLVTLNGAQVESQSNTLTNVVDGVTLDLGKTTTSPVTVTVSSDTAGMRKAVDAFVAAYNEVNNYLAAQTKVVPGTPAALQGDGAAVSMRSALRNLMGGTNAASTVFSRLNQVGLEVGKDGAITVGADKLDKALLKPAELQKLFASQDEATPENRGFGVRMQKLSDSLLAFDGAVTTRTGALKTRATSNRDQQDRLSLRADAVEKRLRAQYTALDANLGKLNGLASYVTQQLNALNRSSD